MWLVFWIIAFSYGCFSTSEAVELRCYNGSLTNYKTASLDNASILITEGWIDITRETMMHAFGYKTTLETKEVQMLISAYLNKVTYNIIVVDWSKEGYSPNMTIVDDAVAYSLAAAESVKIGKQLVNTIIDLHDYGLDWMNAVLIGMSLGCPMLGYAGRGAMEYGIKIKLIVGLDHANPGYGEPLPVFKTLDTQSALSVFCIHTDMGYMGINKSIGTADVYVNQRHYMSGGDDLQPGCPNRYLYYRGCSHLRVEYLYVEGMENPGTLLASGAPNYWTWLSDNGSGTAIDIANEDDMVSARGNFYMTTNSADPYGKGEEGLKE